MFNRSNVQFSFLFIWPRNDDLSLRFSGNHTADLLCTAAGIFTDVRRHGQDALLPSSRRIIWNPRRLYWTPFELQWETSTDEAEWSERFHVRLGFLCWILVPYQHCHHTSLSGFSVRPTWPLRILRFVFYHGGVYRSIIHKPFRILQISLLSRGQADVDFSSAFCRHGDFIRICSLVSLPSKCCPRVLTCFRHWCFCWDALHQHHSNCCRRAGFSKQDVFSWFFSNRNGYWLCAGDLVRFNCGASFEGELRQTDRLRWVLLYKVDEWMEFYFLLPNIAQH